MEVPFACWLALKDYKVSRQTPWRLSPETLIGHHCCTSTGIQCSPAVAWTKSFVKYHTKQQWRTPIVLYKIVIIRKDTINWSVCVNRVDVDQRSLYSTGSLGTYLGLMYTVGKHTVLSTHSYLTHLPSICESGQCMGELPLLTMEDSVHTRRVILEHLWVVRLHIRRGAEFA